MKSRLRIFLEDYKRQIHEEAEKLLSLPMPEITEELFSQYEKNGNRSLYEDVYFTRRKFLTIMGIKALLEKTQCGEIEDKTLNKLIEVILNICCEECWAIPAHLSRKNPDWQLTLDLFAAETGQTISELADRLRNDLPENVYCIMVENVERRILLPFLAAESDYGWEKSDHNWNAVCVGSIGSACLHLMREKKEILDPCIKRVCESLPYYVGGFAEDGTCMEGLGYFTYGMSYFVNFAQELYEYTEGKTDLLCGDWKDFHAKEEDKRTRMAVFWSKCFFADGRTVNFSDGSSQDKYRMGLGCALKRHFPQVQIPDIKMAAGLFGDNCYRFVFRRMDLFETEKYLKQLEVEDIEEDNNEQTKCYVLPDAQWCIAGADNGVGFACKGGHNGEPHNHNDVGHFIYEKSGVILFADLGAGEYTRDYFGDGRYDILCNNSFGHSVPVIAGYGQQTGKEYRCSVFAVVEDSEMCVVNMELSGAYENGLLERFHRQLCFSRKDGILQVQDRFIMPMGKTGDVVENLITQIFPRIQGDRVILSHGNVTAMLAIEGICAERDVMIQEYVHSNHRGKPEKVYAIRWQAACEGQESSSAYTISVLSESLENITLDVASVSSQI